MEVVNSLGQEFTRVLNGVYEDTYKCNCCGYLFSSAHDRSSKENEEYSRHSCEEQIDLLLISISDLHYGVLPESFGVGTDKRLSVIFEDESFVSIELHEELKLSTICENLEKLSELIKLKAREG